MGDDGTNNEWDGASEDYFAGRFAEYVMRMKLILERDRDNSSARVGLATALCQMGELDDSIHEYREVLRRFPTSAGAHAGLAYPLSEKGEGEQAVLECLEALRLEPSNWYAHRALGRAFYQMGMWNAAIFEHREALRLHPGREDNNLSHFGIALSLFAKAYQRQKRYKRLTIWGIGRWVPGYWRASKERSDWDAAHTAIEDYLKSDPANPEALAVLGRTQWALGDKNAAVETFQKALEADPTDPELFAHLIRALLILGRWARLVSVIRHGLRTLNCDPRYRSGKRFERWRVKPPAS